MRMHVYMNMNVMAPLSGVATCAWRGVAAVRFQFLRLKRLSFMCFSMSCLLPVLVLLCCRGAGKPSNLRKAVNAVGE